MPTDDERREVARRLRGGYDVVSDSHGRFWLNGTLFGMDITARSEEQIRDGLARLADLIEPGCDREALLALADKLEEETGSVCGVCMGKTVRRIREACGEAVA